MRDAEPDLSQDPDVTHLSNLLTLLPSLSDQRFWEFLAFRHPNYKEKIGATVTALKTGDADLLAVGCRHLLLYFGDSDRTIWLHLDTIQLDLNRSEQTMPGRLLAEDLCRTAWTLYVRYHDRRRGMQSWGLNEPGHPPA